MSANHANIVGMNSSSQRFSWCNVDGEVASRLGRVDWSANPMGPPAAWSQQLHTVLGLVLQSRSPAAVVWGRELNTLYNDAYAAQLGAKHPESLGNSFSAIWSEIWSDIAPVIDDAMAGMSSYFEDIPYMVAPAGVPTERWYTSSFSPVKDGDGSVVGVYITAVETTQRMQVERRYAFQAELTELVRHLNTSDDIAAAASQLLGKHLDVGGVVYAAVDESGEILTMEPDWTSGASRSLAGAVLRLDDFGPLVGEAVRAGKELAIADVTIDQRSAAHAPAYAERSVRSFVSIPLMKGGRLRAILNLHDSRPRYWTGHEITLAKDMLDRTWSALESARAQCQLRRERDQSQYIFENMTEGFGLIDKDWTIVYMNAAGLRITERTAEQVIGSNHWEVWPELVHTAVGALLEKVKQTRQSQTIEVPYMFLNGEPGWIESRAYTALDGGLAFFFRDITERKAIQEKLQQADRRKDEFLAMLAHELRNPLAPIGAAAELLQMVKLDEARVRQTSQIIGRQVKHMTSLVDDLLDVSRVTRGLVELDNAPLDIGHIVNEALEQVMPMIRSKRHHFALRLPIENAMVRGDKKRLVQVVTNILNNAAKYTQDGGNIALEVDVHAGRVVIEVADDGLGMAPELAARAFDLFTQAERSSDRSSGGLGLGLALVKSLTDLHGGTVTCESAGLGKGSRFAVCLPRLNNLPNQYDAQPIDSPAYEKSGPLRILVVDDNADAASLLAMLLEMAGHQVTVAHGSRRALDLAIDVKPQVCLLDIGLPEMDGNELAQRLRAQPETAHAVLIAATGYGQDSDRKRSAAAGFDHHLVKPLDISRLAQILASLSKA